MGNKRCLPLYIGLLILAGFLLMALAPSLFTPYGPKEMFAPWLKPDGKHLLGTNSLGYDIFTELVYGTGDTLTVGICSSVLTLLFGAFFGIAATGRGAFGTAVNGVVNVFALLPKVVVLMVLATFLGSSRLNLILLIALFSWVGVARSVRAKVIHLKAQPFMENCIIQGYRPLHIVWYHTLPNLSDVLLSQFLMGVNSCIMMESTLSFLGFGDLYHPTWGTMVNFAYRRGAFIRKAYYYLLTPGVCIMLMSLSFYLCSLYFSQRKEIIREG